MISILFSLLLAASIFALIFCTVKLQNKKHELFNLKTSIENLKIENATLSERLARLPEFETRALEHQHIIQDLRHENTKLSTQMEAERKQSIEQREFIAQSQQQMSHQFQALANQILENKTEKFTKLNHDGLENILKPMREQLKDFEKKIHDNYDKDIRDRVSLIKEIQDLKSLNQKISTDAVNLTQALKGDNKVQGNWGELILERILERSGLTRGQEYDIQVSLEQEDEKRYQPDVIVHLPEQKDIIIDSKVSLSAYERFCNAENDEVREKSLREHILSIRSHIKLLSDKAYQNLKGINSLDFVLMFMPIETALTVAMQSDHELFSEALDRNIVIVSPTTLLATLRTIQNIWKFEYQNRNALNIATAGGLLYDKFVAFVEDLTKIGKQLDDTQKTYALAMNKLSTGKGNLIKRTQDMQKLGVKSTKMLAKELIESSEQVLLTDESGEEVSMLVQ